MLRFNRDMRVLSLKKTCSKFSKKFVFEQKLYMVNGLKLPPLVLICISPGSKPVGKTGADMRILPLGSAGADLSCFRFLKSP